MDGRIDPEVWLVTEYKPVAVYMPDCDSVEYVKEDTLCVYKRIDEFLTLIFDETSVGVIGFKLKGFGWLYRTHLKQHPAFQDVEFIHFVKVIEVLSEMIGNQFIGDPKRENAYKQARKIAEKGDVKIDALPRAA